MSPGRVWEWAVLILVVIITWAALAYALAAAGTITR